MGSERLSLRRGDGRCRVGAQDDPENAGNYRVIRLRFSDAEDPRMMPPERMRAQQSDDPVRLGIRLADGNQLMNHRGTKQGSEPPSGRLSHLVSEELPPSVEPAGGLVSSTQQHPECRVTQHGP